MNNEEKLERAMYLVSNQQEQAALDLYAEVLTCPTATNTERLIAFFRTEMIHRPETWDEYKFKVRMAAVKLKEAGFKEQEIKAILVLSRFEFEELMGKEWR